MCLLATVTILNAQTSAITASKIRALTKEAATEAAGDADALIAKLDAKVSELNGGVDVDVVGPTIYYDERLMIGLFTPYAVYRVGLTEALRKRDPIDAVPWITTAFVSVSPSQISSPDIIKVIVERDGKVVPPVSSTLKPQVFTTRMGAKELIHSGRVHYPMSAFAPGATVLITAIPESGPNLSLKLTDEQLRTLR